MLLQLLTSLALFAFAIEYWHVLITCSILGIGLWLDDHDIRRYKPHSIWLYIANLIVNFIPGGFMLMIVVLATVCPRIEQYLPPVVWLDFGLVEYTYEERVENGEILPETDQ
jgi:hypothetical protein